MKNFDSANFYHLSLNYLYQKAASHTKRPIQDGESSSKLPKLDQSDVDVYFAPGKPRSIKGENGRNDIRRLFLRLCFHSQNGAFIRGVINFDKNYRLIKRFTFGFDIDKFLNEYPTPQKAKEKLTKMLILNSGKITKVAEYAESVHSFAVFLSRFDDYDDFVQAVLPYGALAPLYISVNTKGMKILAYDFLKEIDSNFDLCKPDKHIKIIAKALRLVYKGDDSLMDLKVSMAIGDLAKEISKETGENVTAYKLDKLLWLICSETFYFHDAIPNTSDAKREAYLDFILPKLGLERGEWDGQQAGKLQTHRDQPRQQDHRHD